MTDPLKQRASRRFFKNIFHGVSTVQSVEQGDTYIVCLFFVRKTHASPLPHLPPLPPPRPPASCRHRNVNVNQKRYAVASALAATAVPALVMARGHRVEEVPEMPLVVDTSLQTCSKTTSALATLKALGAAAEVEKVRCLGDKKERASTPRVW